MNVVQVLRYHKFEKMQIAGGRERHFFPPECGLYRKISDFLFSELENMKCYDYSVNLWITVS